MAEAVLTVSFESLVDSLKLHPSSGVKKDIRQIIDELMIIRSFLRDAESEAYVSYNSKDFVKQATDVAYSIEDVIDEYTLRVVRDRSRSGVARFFFRAFHPIRTLRIRSALAKQIRELKFSVRKISALKIGSNSYEGEEEKVSENYADPRVSKFSLRRTDGREKDDVIINMDDDRQMLLRRMDESVSKRLVICLVGMGGIGKTTLAQTIYSTQAKSGGFDCYAWVFVSTNYQLNKLLIHMIKQLHQSANEEEVDTDMESMTEHQLLSKTRDYVRNKRYLLVFDDVWFKDFWSSVEHALPDNENGSRIIITSRIRDVASSFFHNSLHYVHELRLLSEDGAWELFCRKVFQSDFGGHCPSQLHDLARQFVRRCGGLPLAISLLGGLLSTKEKSIYQWGKIYESLNSYSEVNSFNISGSLILSFDDLPYNLKSCFLYLVIFPEDYSINCSRLVRLWIAEGFVKENSGRTMEEVAYGYLIELIRRSLVSVVESKFAGKPRSFRIHNLMRDFIMSKSRELSFCDVFDDENYYSGRIARRLSIQSSRYVNTPLPPDSMTRSMFVFKVERWPNGFLTLVFAHFKLLKVLDFQDAPLHKLPKEVGHLCLLKYLSIRSTKIKKLPKSIGKLGNLETLDLKDTLVYELPIQVRRLLNLRYLLARNTVGGVKMQEGFRYLEALQKLYYVNASHGSGLLAKLKNLKKLRKLGVMNLLKTDCQELGLSIEKMHHLQSLHIASISDDEIIDLHFIENPPLLLQDVCLKGRLWKLPGWVAQLRYIVKLYLISSRLIDDPLEALQDLPRLSVLALHGAFDGVALFFKAEGFQQLRRLELIDLKNMSMMKIDNGALPILEELTIGHSPRLKVAPTGIQYLSNLTTLTFVDMSEEFVNNMRHDEGQYLFKVKDGSKVCFNQKKGNHHAYIFSNMPTEEMITTTE